MSFMESYQLKGETRRWLADPKWTAETEQVLEAEGLGLPWQRVESDHHVDPANPRLRTLFADMIENGAWQLLCNPAGTSPTTSLLALTRIQCCAGSTKRLVFWLLDCRTEDAHVSAVL